ncbi:TetR/AcrR family transcriptional regulator [Actinospica robiniae]|uniref:TetR/AcrR family transcriptional regulator n=1 Tax=Actinospica robiniae TaxID=304901 RepID=UPI000683F60F|nr:TetR/AcrR family transcriptional regulator [Actinospica robiniae]
MTKPAADASAVTPAVGRTGPLSGRMAEANRNDTVILDAARRVFIADPSAPISAVAKEAGVGISALYRRYTSKEELLQTLCANGLATYITIARSSLEVHDPWRAFTEFLTGVVDADVHSLTTNLAGSFTPTPQMQAQAVEASRLAETLLNRAKAAQVIRADFEPSDIAMLLEQLTAVRLEDLERTTTLRRRYLALHLDALRPQATRTQLPGPPPTTAELGARWIPK